MQHIKRFADTLGRRVSSDAMSLRIPLVSWGFASLEVAF